MLEKIEWTEIYESWKCICRKECFYELLEPVKVSEILIPHSDSLKKQGIYIKGYDWILSKDFDNHIKRVVNQTTQWLFDTRHIKGMIVTAGYLADAGSNSEDVAAIWIYTCLIELHRYIPDEWRGLIYKLLSSIERAADGYLCGTNYQWHHAMKNLIPDIIFSYEFLENFKPTSCRSMLELCAAICKTILGTYSILRYRTEIDEETDGGKFIAVDLTGNIKY